MSTSHHGSNDQSSPENQALMQRLMDQLEQRAVKREYPDGRTGPNDEGLLAAAITTDRGRVLIDFGKSLSWLSMTPEEAVGLAQMLIQKARLVATEPLRVVLN